MNDTLSRLRLCTTIKVSHSLTRFMHIRAFTVNYNTQSIGRIKRFPHIYMKTLLNGIYLHCGNSSIPKYASLKKFKNKHFKTFIEGRWVYVAIIYSLIISWMVCFCNQRKDLPTSSIVYLYYMIIVQVICVLCQINRLSSSLNSW